MDVHASFRKLRLFELPSDIQYAPEAGGSYDIQLGDDMRALPQVDKHMDVHSSVGIFRLFELPPYAQRPGEARRPYGK